MAYSKGLENSVPEKIAVHNDRKGKLEFGTASSDSLLYLKVIFQDQLSTMNLMRGGLNVYFDVTGKKRKNCTLKLERSEMPRDNSRFNRPQERGLDGPGPDQRQKNIVNMASKGLTKATWLKNGNTFVFDRAFPKNSFRIDFLSNEQNMLVLFIAVPLREIGLEKGQKVFSLGIQTGEPEQSGLNGGGPRQGGMQRGGGMNGMEGGMPGGRMGGGGGIAGGRMGGGGGMSHGPGPGGDSSGSTPVKLWFLVQL